MTGEGVMADGFSFLPKISPWDIDPKVIYPDSGFREMSSRPTIQPTQLTINKETDFSVDMGAGHNMLFNGFIKSIMPRVKPEDDPYSHSLSRPRRFSAIRTMEVDLTIVSTGPPKVVAQEPTGPEVAPGVMVAASAGACKMVHPFIADAFAHWLEGQGFKEAAEALRKKFSNG